MVVRGRKRLRTEKGGGDLDRTQIPLIRAAAKGDKQAFTELVGLYRQSMYATAMAVTRNEDDALDAIQETVLTLWEKLDSLRRPAYFKTWMTRILVNNCCGALRREKREATVERLAEEGEEKDLDTPLDVREALWRLSQDDRLLLQLFYFEDLSVKEIAQVLSVTPEAVRMRLTRGRKRFAEQYETEVRYQHEKE